MPIVPMPVIVAADHSPASNAPDGEVKTFDGHCSVTKGGGGNNDMSKWSVEITASGVITTS